MSVRQHIYVLRDKLGLTQQEFADKIGTTRQTVIRWEKGKNQPTGAAAKAIMNLEDALRKGYRRGSEKKTKKKK